MNIKRLKYEFEYDFGENTKIYEAVIELPPHKRTIKYCKKNLYIEVPFYTIFILSCVEQKNENNEQLQFRQNSPPNRILASKKPIQSLDDKLHTIQYPHVAPATGLICQYISRTFKTKEKYYQEFIQQFWATNNSFFMGKQFEIVKYCSKYNYISLFKSIKMNLDFNKRKSVRQHMLLDKLNYYKINAQQIFPQ